MAIISSPTAVIVAALAALVHQTHSFVVPPSFTAPAQQLATPSDLQKASSFAVESISTAWRPRADTSTSIFMSTSASQSTLSLSLEKPLGLILEESEDGVGGVIVTAVNEGGSAFESPSKEALIQAKISTVMGQDVGALSFDDVMDVIIGAPSPLDIEFAVTSAAAAAAETEDAAEEAVAEVIAAPKYEVGQTVTITVEQPAETKKAPITLEAKVGDNLRKTLLANGDITLYRGMKKKLGNCGGGGQCGFCAVELVDEEGVWGERSDYEATRIGKNGSEKCRLACMNNIVGPATVKTL